MYLNSKKLIVLKETESTNKYAMGLIKSNEAAHGMGVFALNQTAGKGRRDKRWLSEPRENLILSVIIEADELSTRHLFPISMAVALAAYDLINESVKANVKIKWPNDIFINDSKAGGILIENSFKGANWQWSVTGIGLNVNQTNFSEIDKQAVSLKMVSERNFDIIDLATQLQERILQKANDLKSNKYEKMLHEYNEALYARDQIVKLKRDGIVFETKIREVTKDGLLITQDKMERQFTFDEVEFLGIVR